MVKDYMMRFVQISNGDLLVLEFVFFFNRPATTEIYTLSLHDALPISHPEVGLGLAEVRIGTEQRAELQFSPLLGAYRSEEHTSELQSPDHLVCRLLLEKKNKTDSDDNSTPS